LLRLAVVLLLSLLTALGVWLGRRFVEKRRQRVLAGPSLPLSFTRDEDTETQQQESQIRILTFSSADCRQCHQLQTPALRRVKEARGTSVAIIDIDAPSSPDLTQRYQVLTVPTTVVLDAAGKAHAVNYGFASAQRLLTQVDEILASASESN
jgi:thioredoxin-like negative regulator of GroEL